MKAEEIYHIVDIIQIEKKRLELHVAKYLQAKEANLAIHLFRVFLSQYTIFT